MDHSSFTREQLIERIEHLEMLSKQLLNEQEEKTRLEYAWTGNLGHWYWNIKSNNVTFDPLKVSTLGYDKTEVPEHVTYQFFTDKLHPDDYQNTMDAMLNHLHGKINVYEVEYRIKAKDGNYKWFYDRGRITQYDKEGKPAFLAGIVFDITDKKNAQQELERQNEILSEISSIDELTKIANYRSLIEHLNTEIKKVNSTSNPLSIAILDLDDFKKVNDSMGHVFGDQVLAEAADLINKSIRDTDIAGRYGGEEFIVIYRSTSLSQARKISDRIRQAIELHTFVDGLKITISGGVSQFSGESIFEFINNADKKLYEAKRNGKNQIA